MGIIKPEFINPEILPVMILHDHLHYPLYSADYRPSLD